MKKFRLGWVNSATGISGEMRNVPDEELPERTEEAWARAGDGEVVITSELEEVSEYA